MMAESQTANIAPQKAPSNRPYSWTAIIRVLLGLYGCCFLGAGALHHSFTESLYKAWLHSDSSLIQLDPLQIGLVLTGAILIFLSCRLQTLPWLDNWLSNPFAANAMLALLAATLPIAGLELVLRQQASFYLQTKPTGLFARDKTLGWRMKPNTRAQCGRVWIETNEHGLRETAPPKPGGEESREAFRIMILGDSVAFGHNLENDADTFPWKLRERLNRNPGRPVEVINAGVNGYSTWHHLAFLRETQPALQPDMVALAFVLNDVYETHRLAHSGKAAHEPFPWVDQSALVFFLRKGIQVFFERSLTQRAALRQEALEINSLMYEPDSPAIEPHWQAALLKIREINRFCRERQIQFHLWILPVATQLEIQRDGITPGQFMLQALAQDSISAVDLLPALKRELAAAHSETRRAKRVVEDWYLDEVHFTAQGGEMVADILHGHIAPTMPGQP